MEYLYSVDEGTEEGFFIVKFSKYQNYYINAELISL